MSHIPVIKPVPGLFSNLLLSPRLGIMPKRAGKDGIGHAAWSARSETASRRDRGGHNGRADSDRRSARNPPKVERAEPERNRRRESPSEETQFQAPQCDCKEGIRDSVGVTMAKKANPPTSPTFPNMPAVPVGFSFPQQQANLKALTITKADLQWSSFTLSDGSVIKIRPLIVNAARQVGGFTPQGDPFYVMQLATEVRTDAPAHLKMGYQYTKRRTTKKKAK